MGVSAEKNQTKHENMYKSYQKNHKEKERKNQKHLSLALSLVFSFSNTLALSLSKNHHFRGRVFSGSICMVCNPCFVVVCACDLESGGASI